MSFLAGFLLGLIVGVLFACHAANEQAKKIKMPYINRPRVKRPC